MKGTFPIGKFREMETPFYYYDANLLREKVANTINSAFIMPLRQMPILKFSVLSAKADLVPTV